MILKDLHQMVNTEQYFLLIFFNFNEIEKTLSD